MAVAAVGAIGLLLWSTLGARTEAEALALVVEPASAVQPLPAPQPLAALFVSTTKGLFALEDAEGKPSRDNVLTWTGEGD